jgi:hypothetical protein
MKQNNMIVNIKSRIEVLANIAIIIVAVFLIFILAKQYLRPVAGNSARPTDENLIGKKISLPEVDWAANGRTLVLALQSGCHFCTESAPFYKELVKRQSGRSNLKLVAVLPDQLDNAKAYLDSLGVSVENVRRASLSSIGVLGTPTLLLVDNNGVIGSAWKGRLDSAREHEVLEKLQ